MQEPYTLVQNYISCLSQLIFAVKSRKCEFCSSLLYEWFSLMYKNGTQKHEFKNGTKYQKVSEFLKNSEIFYASEWMNGDGWKQNAELKILYYIYV